MSKNELPTEQQLLRKPKKLWWRRLLWVFGGMVLGVGAVAGTGVIMGTTVSSKDMISMFGGDPNELLTEEYQNKTITQLVMSLANGSTSFDNLGNISSITPMVDTVLETLNTTLDEQFGFTLDKETLYAQDWSEIGDYAIDAVYSGIKLAVVMNIDSTSEPLLQYIAFRKDATTGEYNYDDMRSIKDLQNELNDLVHDAQVKDLTNVGTSGVMYNLRNCHLGTLADEIQTYKINQIIEIPAGSPKAMVWVGELAINEISTAFDTATVEDLIDIDPSNTFMNAIKDCKVSTLADEVMAKTIGELTGNNENPEPPIKALKDFTVQDLVNGNLDLNDVKLSDIVDIDPTNTILYALRDSTIGELDNTAKNTVIGELFSEEELNNNRILKALSDYTLATMQQGIGKCHIDDFVEFDLDDPTLPKLLKYLIINEIQIENLDQCFETMTLGDMIDTSGNSILEALSSYTLTNISSGVGTLTIGDVIEITTTSPQILISLQDVTLNDLATTFDTLTLADILPADQISASPILTALQNITINNFSTAVNDLTLGQALGITSENEDEFTKLIVTLKDYKISEVSDAINNVPLSDMIEITSDSPRILYALKDATINNLSTTIEGLTFGDFFDYTSTDVTGNRFLSHIPSDTLLTDLGTAISSLKFAEVYSDVIFDDPSDVSTIKGLWKLLLCRKTGTTWEYVGADYTISGGMGYIIENMRDNMLISTLYELKDAGLIDSVSDEKLDETVMGTSKTLGSYTLIELVSLIPTN